MSLRASRRAAAAELPELFDVGVRARSLAYLHFCGAALALLTLALPHASEVREGALVVIAGIAIVMGIALYLGGERAPSWGIPLAVAAGTTLIALATYYGGVTASYPLLFCLPVIFSFYFFSLPLALGQLAIVGVAYAVVLATQEESSPEVRWLIAVVTPAVIGLLISRLLDNLRRQAGRAQARSDALSQSEARVRLVLDSAPDAFVAIDETGAIHTWNAAAERLFGWPAAEVVGRPLREVIFPPEGRGEHDERLRELLAAPEPTKLLRVEAQLQRRGGATFPAEETISRIVVGDEVVLSAFIRDVTERRRRQREREVLFGEQAARVEAERVTEVISGMQLLVDAALAHRSIGDILADVVTRVRGVVGADAASIFLVEEEGLVLRASSGGDPTPGEAEPIAFGDGFVGAVAEAREPMVSNDPAGDLEDPALAPLDVGALIGFPLLAEDEAIGVLAVCAAAPGRFSADEIGVLSLAADRVALAIDHARVYEREHKIAETLQRSLLPETLPRLPGLSVAARYRPAAAEAEVGGDWYDVMTVPGGRVGLVMGDVAGKGLPAASMVGRMRSALRAYALEGHEPAQALEQLNRLVWTETEDSQMTTLVYAIVDPTAGLVRWVNAGHPPPLLVSERGGSRFLEGNRSVPLGVLPFPSFVEDSSSFEPGNLVLLYTDGLVERAGANIDAGLARLAAVAGSAASDPETLCDRLLTDLVPAGGAPDDVALLALRSMPITDRFRIDLPTEPEALGALRAVLRRWLREAGFDDHEVAEIVTACGEAATNAVEHAGALGDEPFEVAGRREPDGVEISVRDRGAWRPPRVGDQGRGLSLMRALMDTVEITPRRDGTEVRLRRRLSLSEGEGGR